MQVDHFINEVQVVDVILYNLYNNDDITFGDDWSVFGAKAFNAALLHFYKIDSDRQ